MFAKLRKAGFIVLAVLAAGLLSGRASADDNVTTRIVACALSYEFVIENRLVARRYDGRFPDLKPRIDAAVAAFDQKFGVGADKCFAFLSANPPPHWDVLKRKMTGDIDAAVAKVADIHEVAEGFIQETESFPAKTFPAGVVQNLLHWKYHDQPEGEFADGQVQPIDAKGRPTVLSLDFRLALPYSWEDLHDPNLPLVFADDAGRGPFVLDLLAGDMSEAELAEAKAGGLRALAAKRQTLAGKVEMSDATIDGRPAVISVAAGEIDPHGASQLFQMATIVGRKLVVMHVYLQPERALAGELPLWSWKQQLPLFEMIARSFTAGSN